MAAALALTLACLALMAAGSAGGPACPAERCSCSEGGTRVSCRSAGLPSLPPLHDRLIMLDVSGNNITSLPADALRPAAGLRDLNLSANRLALSSAALESASLARLWLDRCGLARLPALRLPRLLHL